MSKGLFFNWHPDHANPNVIDAPQTALIPTLITADEASLMAFYEELGRQEIAKMELQKSISVSRIGNAGRCK